MAVSTSNSFVGLEEGVRILLQEGGRRVQHSHSYQMFERLPEFLAGLSGEGFSLPKSVTKTERNDYFFKRSDINVKLTKKKKE